MFVRACKILEYHGKIGVREFGENISILATVVFQCFPLRSGIICFPKKDE